MVTPSISGSHYKRFTNIARSTALASALAGVAILSSPFNPQFMAQAAPVEVTGVAQPGFSELVEKVRPAVVSVRVKGEVQTARNDQPGMFGGQGFDQLPDGHPLKRFFRDFGNPFGEPDARPNKRQKRGERSHSRPMSQGSGFFISEDGYVVTNNHVVADGTSFSVVLDDGTELDAKLIGTDERTDLAVLKVDDKREFTYVALDEESNVKVGDWVVAVGNPFGLGGTVTAGIVSARGRDIGAGLYDDFVQIDAAVNKGNSGGPAFDLSGKVIGINTAIFSPSGGSVGIAFAIPSSTASKVVNQLIKDGSVERGWIGVQIQPVTKEIADSIGLSEDKGAIVSMAQAGAPAEKAGIVAGDVITAVNDELINDPRDLARKISEISPNEKTKLTVWRNGKAETINVTIEALPNDTKQSGATENIGKPETLDDYGLTVVPEKNGNGVSITAVDPDSDAADKGIRPGDVIVSVNNKAVKTAEEIEATIKEAIKDGRKGVLLQLQNSGQNRFVALPIDQE